MKTKKILFLFVAFVAFGTTASSFAQYGWNGYSAVDQTLATQRQATQGTAKTPSTNARTNARTNAQTNARTNARTNVDATNSVIPQTRLLAFGIDKYSSEKNGLNELQGCVNDAQAVQETFDYAISTLLTDEKATSDAILKKLNEAANANYGRLIVFFGCHGINVQGRSFVCPIDALATEENLSELNEAKDVVEKGKEFGLIPLVDVLNVLKGATANEVLVIFDACRNSSIDDDKNAESGDFARELIEIGKGSQGFARRNGGAFAALTSCSVGQEALEIDVDGRFYGSFAYYLLEGISSGFADYAGLVDGRITLVEAYNYAYSKTATRSQKTYGVSTKQTPERYMSNVSEKFVLKEIVDSTPPAEETDLQFLARTGKILANAQWSKETNKIGLKALNCVLNNIPNDVATRGSRAAVRRKLGDYVGSLDDYSQIGEKFQLYATQDQTMQDQDVALKKLDLLTIAKIEDDRYYVSEVNNDASKKGWIDAKNASWSVKDLNGSKVASATVTQRAEVMQRASSSMISPGPGSVGQFGNVPGPLSR